MREKLFPYDDARLATALDAVATTALQEGRRYDSFIEWDRSEQIGEFIAANLPEAPA